LCTEIAVCHEEVYGGDYRYGSQCVSSCESRPAAERAKWARCVKKTANCKKMLDCN
jgi:hypothetical protein